VVGGTTPTKPLGSISLITITRGSKGLGVRDEKKNDEIAMGTLDPVPAEKSASAYVALRLKFTNQLSGSHDANISATW
jgi:hypothetical protein